jgi:hypothetical protein
MVSTMSATVNVHNVQASRAARWLIPSTPRACSLAPVFTIPFYRTSISQTMLALLLITRITVARQAREESQGDGHQGG